MKILIGLGNPGDKFKNHRHNVGHMVIDALKLKSKPFKNTIVAKSNTYMNDSGTFVKNMIQKYEIPTSNLFIIFDDLDIKLGEYKIQLGKGPKVHNGLSDIYDKLGTKDFWHVRVGVDNRDPENRSKGEDYVLQNFEFEESNTINEAIKRVVDNLTD